MGPLPSAPLMGAMQRGTPPNANAPAQYSYAAGSYTYLSWPTFGVQPGVGIPADWNSLAYYTSDLMSAIQSGTAIDASTMFGSTPKFDGMILSSLTRGRVVWPDVNHVLSGSANLFWDDTNNRLGIGLTDPATRLEVRDSSLNQLTLSKDDNNAVQFLANGTGMVVSQYNNLGLSPEYDFNGDNLNGNPSLRIRNLHTSGATSHAWLVAEVGGASAGDPVMLWDVDFTQVWAAGIDNSDSQKWKLCEGSALGTNDRITVYPTSGNIAFGTGSFFWDNANTTQVFGATTSTWTGLGTSQICAAGRTIHSIANVFAEFGEGRPLGNPTGTVTAALNGAGGLTGAYKYAYTEYDVDGNETGLSPVSLTINPASQQITATIPRGRPGTAGRKLYRTKAGGATYFLLNDFGVGYGFHQTIFSDNTADGSLGAQAPSVDNSVLYKASIRRGETFFAAHPDQAGSTHDIGVITGNPGAAAEWGIDCYHTVVARQSLGTNFYSVHTGTGGYHIQCDYNSDTYGSVVASPFLVAPRGELIMAPVAYTSGAPSLFTWTKPAHTGLTASTEIVDVYFDLGTNSTQWATGAITSQRSFLINAPVLAFVGASTVTNASAFAVNGPTLAGTNATITNSYGITVGTMAAATLSGPKALGLFAAGNCFAIARNTTNNIEMFWGCDATDTYIGARTNHKLRFQMNATTYMTLDAGKLGIGAAPTYNLQVLATSSAAVLLDSAAGSQVNLEYADNGSSKWALYKTTTNVFRVFDLAGSATVIECATGGPKIGFLGATAVARQTVTGSKGANAALASLMTALANLGLVTDSTT